VCYRFAATGGASGGGSGATGGAAGGAAGGDARAERARVPRPNGFNANRMVRQLLGQLADTQAGREAAGQSTGFVSGMFRKLADGPFGEANDERDDLLERLEPRGAAGEAGGPPPDIKGMLGRLVGGGLFGGKAGAMDGSVATDVSELAVTLAREMSASGTGFFAPGGTRDELTRSLGQAFEQANVQVVQKVYAQEVERAGFEKPFDR